MNLSKEEVNLIKLGLEKLLPSIEPVGRFEDLMCLCNSCEAYLNLQEEELYDLPDRYIFSKLEHKEHCKLSKVKELIKKL